MSTMETSPSNDFRDYPQRDGDRPESTEELIERLLTEYPALGEEDRDHLSSLVADRPQYAECVQQARRLDRLLRDARTLNNPDEDTHVLPWVVLEATSLERSQRKRTTFEEAYLDGLRRVLDRARRSDPAKAALERIEEKTHASASGESLENHFSRVTGHSAATIVRRFQIGNGFFNPESLKTVMDHRVTQRVLQIGVTGLMMFVTLFSVSLVRDHGFTRLAQIGSSDYSWTQVGISNRGENPEWLHDLKERYQSAARMAQYSQTTVLGLFPAYDYRRLSLARTMLEKAINMQREIETVPASAHLLLAKIYFHLGQVDYCRAELERALAGRNADRARASTFLNVFENEYGR